MKAHWLLGSVLLLVASNTSAFADEPNVLTAAQEPSPEPQLPPEASGPAPAAQAPVVMSVPELPRDRRVTTPTRARYDVIRVNAGLRVGYVATRGFDTFSSNDVLAQFSVDATYPLLTRGKLVLGAGLGWDIGGRSATTRGFDSQLTAHRFYVPLEARYHIVPSLYAFGKVAPGAAAMLTSITESGTGNKLDATGWAFSGDVSAGVSALIAARTNMERREPRVWITPEVGYGFTTTSTLSASIGREDKDMLGSDEDTRLRGLALSGFFWRASVGGTF